MILTDPPSDYARRIKNIRDVKELTQTQFAERIGVSYASVNRWENEQSRPQQSGLATHFRDGSECP